MEKDRIYFESEEDLPYLPLIGFGSQGTVYKWENEAIKYFAFDLDDSERDLKKFEYFQTIKMADFSFPLKLVFVDGRFYGYTKPWIKGNDLNRQPFQKSFELIRRAITHTNNSSKELAQYKIKLRDMYTANIIFSRNFKFIDCDSFRYSSLFSHQECEDHNDRMLNCAYQNVLQEGLDLSNCQYKRLFGRLNTRLQKQKISSIEYIDEIQNRISDMAGEAVSTVAQGEKVLKKVKSL